MLCPPGPPGIDATTVDQSTTSRPSPPDPDGRQSNEFSWPQVSHGIILAGGAYPLVLSIFFLVISLASLLWSLLDGSWQDERDGFEMFAFLLFVSLIGSVIGLIWASIVTLVTVPIVYTFVWSLKLRCSSIWLGAFCGGLVGFFAVLPLMMQVFWTPGSSTTLDVVIMMGFGPALATVVGQLGGAWGGRRAADHAAALDWQRVLRNAGGWSAGEPHKLPAQVEGGDAHPQPFQFRIYHLLWISVWLSLLLTVIRLCGIPFEFVLPLLAGWTVYQAATLWLGGKIVPRVVSRLRAR